MTALTQGPLYPDLKQKKILITGASRGIGHGIFLALAHQGAHVIFNYRGEKEKILPLIDQAKSAGASAVTAIPFDVRDTASMQKELDLFLKEHGPIEGLVNNAGISKDQLILRLKEQELEEILHINLKGPMMLTSLLSRHFLKAENVSIVNMSSVVGLMGNASQTAYAASKSALIGFTKSVAKELASRGIRCNAICPGFIETEMTQVLGEKVKEHYLEQIPLKKFGQVGDVANLTCFLLSQASCYITGEILKIDGGLYI